MDMGLSEENTSVCDLLKGEYGSFTSGLGVGDFWHFGYCDNPQSSTTTTISNSRKGNL